MPQLNWTARHSHRRPVSIQAAASKRRDDFNCVVALHIEPPGFSIWHRVPRVGFGAKSFGTTMLWRVILQRQQGKSPLAIESIDDRYWPLAARRDTRRRVFKPVLDVVSDTGFFVMAL